MRNTLLEVVKKIEAAVEKIKSSDSYSDVDTDYFTGEISGREVNFYLDEVGMPHASGYCLYDCLQVPADLEVEAFWDEALDEEVPATKEEAQELEGSWKELIWTIEKAAISDRIANP